MAVRFLVYHWPTLYSTNVAKFIIFRYLLRFGKVSHYLGYNAMDDFFPTMSLKPNPDCDDYHCRKRQKIFAEQEAERLKNLPKEEEIIETDEILHDDNDWGISLVGDEDQPDEPNLDKSELAQGLSLAYERRVTMEADVRSKESADQEEEGQSLEDLMKQMKQL